MASVAPASWFCGQNLGVFQGDLSGIVRALDRVDFAKRTKVGNFTILDQKWDPIFPEQGKYKEVFYCVLAQASYSNFTVHVAARDGINSNQFKKERRVLTLLSGTSAIVPSVVRCVGLDGYIISDLFNRGSLAMYIEQPDFIRGALSTHLLAYKIVCALGEFHVRGIILRDLKASNIVVRELEDGSLDVRLIDFGMAYIQNEDSESEATRKCGSPLYISAEEREVIALTGKPLPANFARDLWALGSVMHGLATKKLPPNTIEEVHGSLGIFDQEIKDLVYSNWTDRPPLFSIQERMFTLLKKHFANAIEIQALELTTQTLPVTPTDSPKWAEAREISYLFPETPLIITEKPPTLLERLRSCFSCCCCGTKNTTI